MRAFGGLGADEEDEARPAAAAVRGEGAKGGAEGWVLLGDSAGGGVKQGEEG